MLSWAENCEALARVLSHFSRKPAESPQQGVAARFRAAQQPLLVGSVHRPRAPERPLCAAPASDSALPLELPRTEHLTQTRLNNKGSSGQDCCRQGPAQLPDTLWCAQDCRRAFPAFLPRLCFLSVASFSASLPLPPLGWSPANSPFASVSKQGSESLNS